MGRDASIVNDDVLRSFVTIATYDKIGRELRDRYGGVVTNCEFSIAMKNEGDRERLRRRRHPVRRCRARPAHHSRNGTLTAARRPIQPETMYMKLGRLGVWYGIDKLDGSQLLDFVCTVENNGYSTLWYPESRGYESMSLAAWLLSIDFIKRENPPCT